MANKFIKEMDKEVKVVEEQKIKEQAEAINKANRELHENTPVNTIVETIKDVKTGDYYITKDENGNRIDISGNCTSKVITINGRRCYVCGSTSEELKEDADFIRLSLAKGNVSLPMAFGYTLSGRYIAQIVNIFGQQVLTVGHTEEERKEDEVKARICYAKLRKGYARYDVATAEDLIEAGLRPTKEFEKDGYRYIYFADQKCARDFEGVKVADISDVTDKLSVDTAIELLKARIETPVLDDDYDDYDDYDEDECCGDCPECWNDDCDERKDW